VVAEGLLKVSGSGAYAKLTQATAKATKEAYAHGCGTDATVIARVASNALSAKPLRSRNETRATPPVFGGRWLGPITELSNYLLGCFQLSLWLRHVIAAIYPPQHDLGY